MIKWAEPNAVLKGSGNAFCLVRMLKPLKNSNHDCLAKNFLPSRLNNNKSLSKEIFLIIIQISVPDIPAEERKKMSPQKRMASQRRFQSLDLNLNPNLNIDGASSLAGSDTSSNFMMSNWHNFSFMKQKASFLYGNQLAMSRRTSDASSFVRLDNFTNLY